MKKNELETILKSVFTQCAILENHAINSMDKDSDDNVMMSKHAQTIVIANTILYTMLDYIKTYIKNDKVVELIAEQHQKFIEDGYIVHSTNKEQTADYMKGNNK